MVSPPAARAVRAALLLGVAWVLSACAGWAPVAPRPDPAPLPPAVLQALSAAQLQPGDLAAVALPIGFEAPVWRHQATRLVQPGSTMKLVTSVVALDTLGPNHRGHTSLLSAAPVVNGVLKGDLVLQGGADPDFGLPQLWALLADLRAAGVQAIEGDVVLDRSLFRPARLDVGLPPFDEAPAWPYNVIPDALGLAGSLLPLELRATPEGVRVQAIPALPGITLASRQTLVDGDCSRWDAPPELAAVQRGPRAADGTLALRVELLGPFPRQCIRRASLQLVDRDELADAALRGLWQGLGGRWQGVAREGVAPAGARVLARRSGRPWGEHLRVVNKTSDNPMTRLLFLQLGVPAMAAQPQATTAELAGQAVQRWFTAHQIDATGLVMDNGSGLSRSERISPQQLAQLLAVAWQAPYAPDFLMSLPVAGVDGGVSQPVLKDSPAARWARLKTGSLRNVAALAGYVRDAQGRPWAVALVLNRDEALPSIAKAREALAALVDHWARDGLAPPPR